MKALLIAIALSSLLVSTVTQTGVSQSESRVPGTESMAPMVLNGYSRYPHNIASAPVYDLDGHRVGLIQKLEADPTGKPSAIVILLASGRTLTVEASNISYDEQRNIVTAGLNDAQLGLSLPPAAR
jgi:hypothetical protein